MALADRDYVRQRPGRPQGFASLKFLSFNAWLIIINVAVYAVQALAPLPTRVLTIPSMGKYTVDVVYYFGHFSTGMGFLPNMEVWRLVTFQFLHAGHWHLFLNMFGLWIFGGIVEQYLGFKRYAAFYLVCGICGGLMYLLLNLLGHFGVKLPGVLVDDIWTPLVGASAGVFGVILAAAYIDPKAVFQLIFPPIALKLRTLAYGYVTIALINLLWGGANRGGDAAHIGGAIAGFFFIRNTHLLRDFFDVLGDSRKTEASKDRRRARDDVDRILAKVRNEGLSSLTDDERQTLHNSTARARRSR